MRVQYIFFYVLVIYLVGCEGPAVTFELPQPIDVKNQERFPKKLIGKYLSVSDSTIITISDKAITRGFNIQFVMCKKELDSVKHYVLQRDTLYNKLTQERICIVNIKDSLYTPFHLQDTLFLISDKGILRKDKGYYFLNIKYHSGWEVQKLEFTKGKILLCSIADIAEIENLKEITEEDSKDSLLQFNPDKKEFHKFVKSKGFSKKEEFVKLK